MRFGNTPTELRKVMIIGLLTGVIAYTASVEMFVFYERLPMERLIPLTFILLLPAFFYWSRDCTNVNV